MNHVLNPAIKLMRNFRIAHKFAFVAAAFGLPIFILMALLFHALFSEVSIAKKERAAIQVTSTYQALANELQFHRSLHYMKLQGNKEIAEKLTASEAKINEALSALEKSGLDLPEPQSTLANSWSQLLAQTNSIKAADSYAEHSKLLKQIRETILHSANDAKLNLDDELVTHQLASIFLTNIPTLTEKLAFITGKGAAYIDTGLLDAGDDIRLNALVGQSSAEIESLLQQTAILKSSTSVDADKLAALESALRQANQFLTRAKNEILNSVDQTKGSAFFDASTTSIQQLIETEKAIADLVEARLNERIRIAYRKSLQTAGAIIAILLFAIYVFMAIYRSFSDEVENLILAAESVAKGDLQHVIEPKGKDELAQLVIAFGKMRMSLSQLVTNIRATATSITDVAQDIHVENADLSKRTESQASSLEQTASSIEELSITLKSNSEDSSSANQLISKSAVHAKEGSDVMEQAIGSMEAIKKSSSKIAEIISVIDGIAFQTNLLALNAAVEAARAGPEGRGFAVVASEVRNLAQRSTEAAKEIKGLINASSVEVNRGSELIQAAGNAMNGITENVREVNRLMSHIANSSKEQSVGIALINQAIIEIDQVTQDNSALVSQAAESTQHLICNAASLNEAVSVFKTSDANLSEPNLALSVVSREPSAYGRASKSVTRMSQHKRLKGR